MIPGVAQPFQGQEKAAMSSDDSEKIDKVAARERDLVAIYDEIYPVLAKTNRGNLPDPVIASLEMLDRPEAIAPSKAAAVLKAIRGSTPQDKFQLEHLFQAPMPGGNSLGGFVGGRLKQIGLDYHDFLPYLRKHGWVRTES